MLSDFATWMLSVAGGGLAATWGMLKWTNGRIRRLEINTVRESDCQLHLREIHAIHDDIRKELQRIGEAVARVEGYLQRNSGG